MGNPDVFLYHPSVVHQPRPAHENRPTNADTEAADGGRWQRFRAEVTRRALALGRWVIALSLVAAAYAGGKLFLDLEPEILPVRLVTVDGEVHRLSSEQLQRTVTEHLDGGFLTLDLKRIQRAVDDLPWVRTATLHRVWPDRVALKVEEYRPIARWGADGLVTADGEVFRPKGEALPTTLPRLSADDAQASLVAANYQKWRGHFVRRGLELTAVDLDARGA
ncbi:MAG TPA: FtsQ-type POTRA domain-containing protein, partial [Chromatiaceae bacterium]|nr:FtsQ-type POTRA domain-containing protein [Chromatiaceae bacterium]